MADFATNFTEPENDVPKNVWDIIHKFLLDRNDQTLDLRVPHIKNAFIEIYPFIAVVYGVLIVFGVGSNLTAISYIIYYKLYKDETYAFLLNNCVSDLIKCVLVLPITLFVVLVNNWVLGELLCPVLPMIQVSLVCNKNQVEV